MFILLCGHPLFNGVTNNDIFESIESGHLGFPNNQAWSDKSDRAKDFIKCLLRRDPSRRLMAKEAFDHPWIAKNTHCERTIAKDDNLMARIQKLRCSIHRLNTKCFGIDNTKAVCCFGRRDQKGYAMSVGILELSPSQTIMVGGKCLPNKHVNRWRLFTVNVGTWTVKYAGIIISTVKQLAC